MLTLIVIALVIAMLFSAPAWPYSRGWGYYPSGALGVALIVVVLFLLLSPRV